MIANLKPYPKMRDSGISWVGDVPEHWAVRRLRQVADMRVSNVDKLTRDDESPVRLCNYVDVYKHDRIGSQLPFMRATATPEEIERFRLQACDVLITKDSESWDDIGVPALVEQSADDLICGYHLALLRPFEGAITGSFLFRTIQSNVVARQFHIAANGVTRYGLTHSGIKSVWLPVPPVSDQDAIVRFLDVADRRISRYIQAKQKLIKLLEEQKHAIIHQAVTRGLDPNVRLKPSGVEWLGGIPEHWDVMRSRFLFRPRTELAGAHDVQLSATQAYGVIPQREYERRVGRKIVKILLHLEKRRHVELGDFVMSMRSFQGGLERAWAAGCIRSSYVVLRPTEAIDIDFYGYVFKSASYIAALQSTADFIRDGQDLNFDNFCAVDLVLPPIQEQRLIARTVAESIANLSKTADRARQEIDLLREYRIRLVADTVTGKLDVRGNTAMTKDGLEAELLKLGDNVAENAAVWATSSDAREPEADWLS